MRELKFRAWFNGMGEPFEPFDPVFLSDGGTFPDGTIFMQYTGLKDKNGKEIYEGDVVRTYMGNICEIRWGFVSESSEHQDFEYTGFCFHHLKQNMNYHLDVTSSCEVIGNIYENPELIKHGNNL